MAHNCKRLPGAHKKCLFVRCLDKVNKSFNLCCVSLFYFVYFFSRSHDSCFKSQVTDNFRRICFFSLVLFIGMFICAVYPLFTISIAKLFFGSLFNFTLMEFFCVFFIIQKKNAFIWNSVHLTIIYFVNLIYLSNMNLFVFIYPLNNISKFEATWNSNRISELKSEII